FTVSGGGAPQIVTGATDFLGRAQVALPLLLPGDYTITASYGGTFDAGGSTVTLLEPEYRPAIASTTVTITRAAQTIDFAALAGRTYGESPLAVSASASSDLAVSFSA